MALCSVTDFSIHQNKALKNIVFDDGYSENNKKGQLIYASCMDCTNFTLFSYYCIHIVICRSSSIRKDCIWRLFFPFITKSNNFK